MRLSVSMIILKGTAVGSRMSCNLNILMWLKCLCILLSCMESIDGKTSTRDDPHIIKEHLFVISDDDVQDFHSVHRAQELVKRYLEDQLKMNLIKLHEFTDGCAAQYKSRRCIGDLSCCFADYGYQINRTLKHHMLKVNRMLQDPM